LDLGLGIRMCRHGSSILFGARGWWLGDDDNDDGRSFVFVVVGTTPELKKESRSL
jgi:hypothetical protein